MLVQNGSNMFKPYGLWWGSIWRSPPSPNSLGCVPCQLQLQPNSCTNPYPVISHTPSSPLVVNSRFLSRAGRVGGPVGVRHRISSHRCPQAEMERTRHEPVAGGFVEPGMIILRFVDGLLGSNK